ncbi:MAG: helix-turn-helix transcriptional regulator [Candidatus Pacebacteria bacterium]|nr:helix-turn-helix transcriptional regulator [Candidatus Paceibacterota bacterium]
MEQDTMSRQNNSKSTIAKNIKKLRQSKGISQDRLSKLADLSLNSVVNIEAGNNPNPTIETLQKIARALGISVSDLFKT